LTYLSFGASAAVKGAGKGAQAARSLKKVGLLDNIDIYAKNAGKVSEAAGDIGKRESLLKMSATDAIQNPVKQSGTSASKASDSLGKEFENALAGDKHFKKAAEAKGAKRGSKEWNKMVDEVKDANISDGYMRFRLPGGIVDTSFGSGLAPGVDRLARGMRYSRPIIGVTSRMSKTFEGAKTPESQKAIREAKNLLQQDFVVSKQEMFDNIRQLDPLLNDFNKYNEAGEVAEEVSGEVLQQKRNQMGNFMIEYLEDVGRVRKQDDQLIAEELMDEDSGILEFMLSRDEIFEETSQDYAARFLKEKYDALKGSDNAEIAEQADDIIARLQASIEPLNRIKTQMDDLVVEASDMNVDVTQLQDLYASYFPRIRQTSKGTITGNKSGGSKLFDPETPHKIQREDRYRNIVGGTAALNRMSTDTRFAGRLSPTLWNKTKELAEKKGQLQDEFFSVDKGYGAEMANLSDDAKKDLFKAITERTPEDVQKNIPLFSVNPADAALRALESAYKARSNADVLRKIVADSMVIRDRGIDETEAAIKNAFGVEGAESALGTVSEAAQTVGRGTDQNMSDVVRQLDIQDGRTPPDQTGAGVKRPDRPDGPGGDGNPATPEPDGPTGGTPDGSPSPVQEGDAKAVAEIIENIPARQTDPEYMSDEEIISRLDALSRLESSKNAGDRELAASARQQIQEERPQIFDESLRLDDAAETATIESRIREISESSLEELTAEGGVLAVNAPALRKLRNELFGEGHGLKGRSAEQIRQTIYQEAKKRAGKAKQDSVQENLSNIKFDDAEIDVAPLEPGEMLSQFDASDSRSLNVLDATGFFMGKSDGASYMIRLADDDQSSALASLGRNRTPASDNTMRAARESVQDFEDKIVRSVSGDAKYQGYAEVEGMQLSQYVDGLGNRFIVPGRVVDTIEDMYPDAIMKSYQERNQVAGLVFLDEDANVLARVEKLASKSAAAQKAETLRTAAKRPSTSKLDDALSEGTGPRERRATGELELTNEQMRAISHRLDDPDSIAESLQSQMLDGDDELIERLGYSQAADEAEFRERVGEVSEMLAAGRFDEAMKQDGELAAEILEQSVDDSINTYLDMARQERGGDLTRKQFNTIKREFARAKQSVESYLKVPPRAVDQLDPAASARDRVYSQMIETVGEEQAAANIALSDAFANQVVKSENNVGSVDEYYERYLTQVRRLDEYVKGREDTLSQAALIKGQPVSSLVRTETDPLVLAQSRHPVFRSQYDVWILTRDESLKPGATSGEKHNLAFKAWMKSDLSAGDFQAIGDARNSEWISQTGIPSNDRLRQILSSDKRDKVVDISQFDGQRVGVRIDIPAFESSGEYVVTLHEGKAGGKPIAYTGFARVDGEVDLRLSVGQQKYSNKIASGDKNKDTIARAYGELSAPQGAENVIPADIDSWTPLGFNPKKANFFYDKRTGQEVRRGNDVIAVGNTLFMREVTEFGNARNASEATRFDILKQSAFHGNGIPPFDAFTLGKIGTGEGVQAYGYGLYFASSKGVAKYYRDALSGWSYRGTRVTDQAFGDLYRQYDDMSIGEAQQMYFGDDPFALPSNEEVIAARNSDPNYLKAQVIEHLRRTQPKSLSDVEREMRYKAANYNTSIQRYLRSSKIQQRDESGLFALDVLSEEDVYPAEDIIAAMYRMADEGDLVDAKGTLYEVDLAPKDSEYLMWDEKAFGPNASPVVAKALDDILVEEVFPLYEDGIYDAAEASIDPGIALLRRSLKPEDFIREIDDMSVSRQALMAVGLNEDVEAGRILHMLEDIFSPKETSEMLLERGVKGIKFLDGTTRGTNKPARYNFVIFDDADVHIQNVLHQRMRDAVGTPRGTIFTNQLGEEAVITLFNGSDLSTLPHELSHAFRRQLHLLDDDLLLRAEQHYGVNAARWTVEQEEAFAEDFERYLSIGKAPTKELESVFSKMKQWLIDVYKGAIGTPLERELSDEMRDIFDTMLGKEPAKRGPDVPSRPKVSKKEHHRRRDILADYYGVHKNSITRARREEIEDALAVHLDDAIDGTKQAQMLRLLRDKFSVPRKKKNGVFAESEKQHLNRIDANIMKMVRSARNHVERGVVKKGHIVDSLNERTGRGGDYSTWQFSDDATASQYVGEHSPIISKLSPTENNPNEAIFQALLELEINREIVTLKKRRGAKGPLSKYRDTIAMSKPDIYSDEQILDLTDKLARERGQSVYEQVFGVDQLDEEGDIFDQVIASYREAENASLSPDEQFQRAIVRQDPKSEMFEAGKYFDQNAFDRADTGYKSRRTIVEMDIQDFLRMAERLDQARPSSQADVAAAVAEGQKFSDLPYLSFSNDGKGTASVVGHEGRHRAMELAAQGETKMPVILESAGGQEIRWSEQGKRSGFDRVSGTWPKELVTQNRGSADSIPFPIEDPLEVSQPGIQPAAPLLNEDAVAGDQMGLFQGEGKRRKFRSDIKKGPKAKQGSLFETSNAKVDRDQMDLFGDDATPEDLVYKPKPDEGKDPDMLFQSAFSGVKREVRNAEGEVVAQVEMPSSKWATNSKRTVVRAMDGARPQDMVRVMSDLVVEELDRLDPSLSQQAQKTYGVVNNNWDLRITKGGVTKSAREWMAEDMVRFSEGKIKPPVGMHKYMAGFKQHLSKLIGKRGESLANDVRVGQLFNELLKPESSGMVPFFSETGESVMGAMGVNLDALRSTTKKLNHRGDRARKAMVALIPPEAAETARQNILRERHSARRRRWIENRDNWQNEADELKGKLEDLAGSDDKAAISELRSQLRGVERQIQDIPEASYDDWYRNALRSDKRKYKGVELDIEPQMWLGQVKLPRRIAEDLVSVSKATTYLTDDSSIGSLIGWFDGYNKLFKTNVTSTNPGFHVRNYFSGFIQNALNDVTDPRFGAMDIRRYTKPYGDSQSLMKGKTIEGAGDIPLFSDLKVAKGQNKDEVATEEIAELLFIHEIINAPGTHRDIPGEAPATLRSQMIGPSFGKHDKVIFGRNSFALNRSKTAPVAKRAKASMSQSEKAVVRVRDTYKKYLDVAQNIGDAVEIQHRAGGFIALLRQGYSPEEAARIVKLVQVDYSNLSSFEKEYMRRFFPFYSFSRGMSVYLANELATNPAGKVGIAIRAQRHGRDRDVATPTYISKGLSLPMGSNADGTRHYLTNIGMMHEQPVQQLAPFAALNPGDAAFNVIGNMNPLLKLPLELAFDESSFQQSVSGGVDLDDADPPLGRALSNVAQGLGLRDKDRKQPYRLGKLTEAVAGASPFSRYTNTVRTAFDPRKNIAQRAANTLTGLRISSVSPQRQDAVLRERAELFLQTQGARQFQKSYIPDEIKANMTEEELRAVSQYELLIEILAKRSKERRKNQEKGAN
jgi:hypothetical protein